VHIYGIAYAVGQTRRIDEIPSLRTAEEEDVLALLTTMGLEHYCEAQGRPMELAITAVERTLAAAGLSATHVDMVLLASTTFDTRSYYTDDFAHFTRATGLEHVTPIGVYLSECANIVSALRLAASLLAARHARRILLVALDTFAGDAARLRNKAMTVNSDGAAACIVSSESGPAPSFELLGLAQATHQQARLETDPTARFMTILKGVREAVEAVKLDLGPDTARIRTLLTNNYHMQCQRMLALQCNMSHRAVFIDNLSKYAHLSSSDTLVNLLDYANKTGAVGEPVLAIATGLATWGAMGWRITKVGDAQA
jgi:3-oxoacyl-[acyl-carrier-protein] synthase III